MKSFTTILAVAAALASGTKAFWMASCTNDWSQNFGKDGNPKCRVWGNNIGGTDVQYNSNTAFCALTAYTGTDCTGETWSTTTQDECVTVPWLPNSFRCT